MHRAKKFMPSGRRDARGEVEFVENGEIPILSFQYDTRLYEKSAGQKVNIDLQITTSSTLSEGDVIEFDGKKYRVVTKKKTYSMQKSSMELVK